MKETLQVSDKGPGSSGASGGAAATDEEDGMS